MLYSFDSGELGLLSTHVNISMVGFRRKFLVFWKYLFILWSYLGCKTINLPYKKCAYTSSTTNPSPLIFMLIFQDWNIKWANFCKNQWSILSTWSLRFSWWAFFWALHPWALIWIRTRINVEGKSSNIWNQSIFKNSLCSCTVL